jgi:FAD/FMN-containing dehydrogenase
MSEQIARDLERRLRVDVAGELLFDDFSRGRYATDASMYQMLPLGVVVPSNLDDVRCAIDNARDAGVPLLARGGGTSTVAAWSSRVSCSTS